MKRNEMVGLIVLYNDERLGNGPLAHLTDEEFADYLLSKLEEQGMLPPLVKLSHIDAYDNGWED